MELPNLSGVSILLQASTNILPALYTIRHDTILSTFQVNRAYLCEVQMTNDVLPAH